MKRIQNENSELKNQVKQYQIQLENQVNQANKIRAVGRSFKERFEKSEGELAEKRAALSRLEEELKKAKEKVTAVQKTAYDEMLSVIKTAKAKREIAEAEFKKSTAQEQLKHQEELEILNKTLEEKNARIQTLESEILTKK